MVFESIPDKAELEVSFIYIDDFLLAGWSAGAGRPTGRILHRTGLRPEVNLPWELACGETL